MANVVDLIKADHQKLSELFSHYETAEPGNKDGFVAQIVAELKRHAHAEEVTAYPKLKVDTKSHAIIEHQEIKQAVAAVETGDDDMDTLVANLKAVVDHHVAEEETNVLPELEASGEDLEAL